MNYSVALLAGILGACALGACAKPDAHDHDHDHAEGGHDHHDHGGEGGGVTFAPGQGLLLAEETRQALGLRTAPVEMRSAAFAREIAAQVFRAADEAAAPDGGYAAGEAYASALVPTEIAAGLAPGATFLVQAPPPAAARLARVDRQTEQPLDLVELVIALPDPAARWRVGARVPLALLAPADAPPALVVPEAAVLRTAQGAVVYAVNGRHLVRTPVQTGRTGGGWTEVRDGLFEGDEVAVTAVDILHLSELRAVKGGGHSH